MSLSKSKSRGEKPKEIHRKDQATPIARYEAGIEATLPAESAQSQVSNHPGPEPVRAVLKHMAGRGPLTYAPRTGKPLEQYHLKRNPARIGESSLKVEARAVRVKHMPYSLISKGEVEVGQRPVKPKQGDEENEQSHGCEDHRRSSQGGTQPRAPSTVAAPRLHFANLHGHASFFFLK